MIIRSRDSGKQSLWSRWFGNKQFSRQFAILSEIDFAHSLAQEIARCDRRENSIEFVLIVLNVQPPANSGKKLSRFCKALRDRLRITDEIGWRDNELCVLLPETDRLGGEQIASEAGSIAFDLDLKLDVIVLVYPEDDNIAANSEDLHPERTEEEIEAHVDSLVESPEVQKETRVNSIGTVRSTPVWKRAIDIVGSLIALTLFAPVFVLISIAIKLDSPGPVFYRQKREGKDGRIFEILKFRTMQVGAHAMQKELREQNANEQDGPAFKITHDPRITRVGRYLRKVCLDEMPQMLNVLLGDMSLVGPRPLPVGESFASHRWHRRRLEVLPGLTCIWQVQGRRDIEFDEWMRMDMEYIRTCSPVLDAKLLFQTAMVVILHRGSV